MIALFKGKYQKADYEYLDSILDEILTHHAMCNSNCGSCVNTRACKDLHRLHRYIHEALENEKNSKNNKL